MGFFETKKMDSRPVVPRTDASAEDFWSRLRGSAEVSPDFKIRKYPLPPSFRTPYNQQEGPFWGTSEHPCSAGGRSHLPLPPVRTSRTVERLVLHDALQEIDANIRAENLALKEKVRRLETQLAQALRINHALTGAMVRDAAEKA